jgi:predicted negative regulator of RcsB-dependent stress response
MLLDEVLEDLLEQIQGIEDQSLVKKFHRLIGDVYIKQKRFSEAMAAYKGKL